MAIRNSYKIGSIMLFMMLSFFSVKSYAQLDSINYNKRKKIILTSEAIAYSAGMTGLYQLWYSDYPQTSFHFFNDNSEWQYQDKLGHVGTAYYLSRWSGDLYKFAGYSNQKASLLGAATGFGFQLTVEMMDGFSKGWGFSKGDLLANTVGASIYYLQQLK